MLWAAWGGGSEFVTSHLLKGFPADSDGKESICNAGDVGSILEKIPWTREWLPTPVLWPGEFHAEKTLVGCSPWGLKELDMIE